jgi:hypothetical protein
VIYIDGNETVIVEVVNKDSNLNFAAEQFQKAGNEHTLDILVENLGFKRVYMGRKEFTNLSKGLKGEILIDDKIHTNLETFPLQFKQKFVEELKAEKLKPYENVKHPAVNRAELDIAGTPKDTFLKLDNNCWTKTVVSVNVINVERLWSIGPEEHFTFRDLSLKKAKMMFICLSYIRLEISLNSLTNRFGIKICSMFYIRE